MISKKYSLLNKMNIYWTDPDERSLIFYFVCLSDFLQEEIKKMGHDVDLGGDYSENDDQI